MSIVQTPFQQVYGIFFKIKTDKRASMKTTQNKTILNFVRITTTTQQHHEAENRVDLPTFNFNMIMKIEITVC